MDRAVAQTSNKTSNSNDVTTTQQRNDGRQVARVTSLTEDEKDDAYIEDTIRRLDKIIQRQFRNLEKHLPRAGTVDTCDSLKYSISSTTNGNQALQPSSARDLPLTLAKGVREPDDSSVIITTSERNGQRLVHVEMDVGGFSPDDIRIRTNGCVLRVSAATSERREGSSSSFQRSQSSLNREVSLPDEVRSQNLQCWLNDAGWLVVEGPLGRDVQQISSKQDRRVTFQDLQ